MRALEHRMGNVPEINIIVFEAGFLVTIFQPRPGSQNETVQAFKEMIPLIRKEQGDDWKNKIDEIQMDFEKPPIFKTLVAKTWKEVIAIIDLYKPEPFDEKKKK